MDDRVQQYVESMRSYLDLLSTATPGSLRERRANELHASIMALHAAMSSDERALADAQLGVVYPS